MSKDNIIVKNTFIEFQSPTSSSIYTGQGSTKGRQRSRTVSGVEFWVNDTYDDNHPPKTAHTIFPTPPSSPEPTVEDESPSGANDPPSSGYTIAWIDERAFKEVALPMKLELSEYASKTGDVKCYKNTAKFLRTFQKKHRRLATTVIVCSPQNFSDLVTFVNSTIIDGSPGIRGIVVFPAKPMISSSANTQCIFASEWDDVLHSIKNLTFPSTS